MSNYCTFKFTKHNIFYRNCRNCDFLETFLKSLAVMATLVSQGAEGRLFETTFLGRPCLVKERFKKSYRHPVLDEKLTNKRLAQEVYNYMLFSC